jgi:hypothetical protein
VAGTEQLEIPRLETPPQDKQDKRWYGIVLAVVFVLLMTLA